MIIHMTSFSSACKLFIQTLDGGCLNQAWFGDTFTLKPDTLLDYTCPHKEFTVQCHRYCHIVFYPFNIREVRENLKQNNMDIFSPTQIRLLQRDIELCLLCPGNYGSRIV